ncbi:unnamed protein product [Schistosoma curassoni]|uniref:Uncharacterized protein n=1 Tax=Schistosoma curassoni TaxID=6186 RepID=A0A183JSE6_9TREM|nr:unnamed protein product [Schistosoma curassoni]
MITGDLEPSSGHIIVVGHDLNRNLRKASFLSSSNLYMFCHYSDID